MAVYKPTLEEVFQMVASSDLPAAKKVQFNIETKISPAAPELFPTPEEFVSLVLDVVKKFGFEERVILQSFDHRTLRVMKQVNPRIRLAPLFEGVNLNFALVAKELGAQYISPEHIWMTKADVDQAHKEGLKVVPWTANTEPEWERLLSFGVDGIISDDPEALLQFLRNKKLR
jgi:glycerophosphoryl diester phosphodiesterase